jgi:hypothetical protein
MAGIQLYHDLQIVPVSFLFRVCNYVPLQFSIEDWSLRTIVKHQSKWTWVSSFSYCLFTGTAVKAVWKSFRTVIFY